MTTASGFHFTPDISETIVERVGEIVKDRADNYLSTALRDPDSVPYKAVNVHVYETSKIIADNKPKNEYAVAVTPKLDESEKLYLKKHWCEFSITFHDSTREAHAVAHVSRILEERLLHIRSGVIYNNLQPTTSIQLVDIGGNYLRHAKNRKRIHSCCPILNNRDSFRFSDRNIEFKRLQRECPSPVMPYNKYYCNMLGEDCDVKCDQLIFLHSIYDMTSQQIASIMERKEANRAYGSIIFNRDMIYRESGFIKSFKLHWRKSKDEKGDQLIHFAFEDDLSETYTHKFKNYVSILTTYIKSKTGRTAYHVALEPRGDAIILFKIVRAAYVPKSISRMDMWLSAFSGKLLVPVYDWSNKYASTSNNDHIIKRLLVVNEGFYETLISYAHTKNASQFSTESLNNAAVSFKNRVIINGNVVTASEDISSEDMIRLCTHIFLRVYNDRWKQGKVIETIVNDLKKERKSSSLGWWRALGNRITRLLTPFKKIQEVVDLHYVDNECNVISESFMDKLYQLIRIKSYLSVFELEPYHQPMVYKIEQYIKAFDGEIALDTMFDDVEYPVHDHSVPNLETAVYSELCETISSNYDGVYLVKNMSSNCLYDSVMALMSDYQTIPEFKRYLLTFPILLPSNYKSMVQKDLEEPDSISPIIVLKHISNVMTDYTFYLHMGNETCIKYGKGKTRRHLVLHNQHFSPAFKISYEMPEIYTEGFKCDFTLDSVAKFKNKYSKVENRRKAIVNPSDVGYDTYLALEIQEIFYHYGTPKKALLLKCFNNIKTNGVAEYLINTDSVVYTDNTYSDSYGFKVSDFNDSPLNVSLRVKTMGIFDTIYLDTFNGTELNDIYLHSRRSTKLIISVQVTSLSDIIPFLNKYHYLKVLRSGFSYLDSKRVFIVCSDLDLSRKEEHDYATITAGAMNRYVHDLITLYDLASNSKSTISLTDDDYRYVVYRYIKARTMKGAGLISDILGYVNNHVTVKTNYNEVFLHNGLYDDFNETSVVIHDPVKIFKISDINEEDVISLPSPIIDTFDLSPSQPQDPFPDQDIASDVSSLYEVPEEEIFRALPTDTEHHVTFQAIRDLSYGQDFLNETVPYAVRYNAAYEILENLRIKQVIVAKNALQVLQEAQYSEENGRYFLINPNIFANNYAVFMNGVTLHNETGYTEFEYHATLDPITQEIVFKKPGTIRGLSVACRDTEKFLEPKFYSILAHYKTDLRDSIPQFKYTLYNGVPGAGKTSHILNNIGCTDLVLFPTRNSRDDFIERLRQTHRRNSKFVINTDNYLTVFQFLVRPPKHYDRVYVDEARMSHPGVMIIVAAHSSCLHLIMYGDKYQIPYLNRTAFMNMYYTNLDVLFSVTSHLSLSYRCPRDVVNVFRELYGEFETVSGVDDSMECTTEIKNIEQLKIYLTDHNFDVIMTFTQSEKMCLSKEFPRYSVNTINEYQGQQCRRALVVRINNKRVPVYDETSQCLVAMTRHTNYLLYANLSQVEDKLQMLINGANVNRVGGAFVDNVDYKVSSDALKLTRKQLYTDSGEYNHKYLRSVLKDNVVVDYNFIKKNVNINTFLETFKHLKFTLNRNDVSREKEDVLERLESNLPVIPTVIERYEDFDKEPLNNTNLISSGRSLIKTDYQILQVAHDRIFGPAPDMSLDQYQMEHSDRTFNVDNLTYCPVKSPYTESQFSYLTPMLRTVCPFPHRATQKETLYALIKRNMAVPELVGDRNIPDLVTSLFVHFRKVFFKRSIPVFSTISYNRSNVFEWLREQPSNALPDIDTIEPLFFKNINHYDCTVKRTPKVNVEKDATTTYPALQTICFQGPYFNCIFCPIMKELRHRFISILKSKFHIFTDKSIDEFERDIDHYFSKLPGTFAVEIDMSKYDKSQDEVALKFEMCMFSFLGLDKYFVDLWYEMHKSTTLYDRMNKIKTKCYCQRKSGDAATFFGNTMFLMMTLSSVYDLDNCTSAFFAGDDSLIFLKNKPSDKSDKLAHLFNLESKLLTYKNYYFCSKFILFTETGTYVIPDPAKLLIKLGRHDIRNDVHLKEYVTSLRDLVKGYDNSFIDVALSEAMSERYPNSMPDLHKRLFTLINSDDIYSLFYLEDGKEQYPPSDADYRVI